MNGAQALFKALVNAGLDTCFANPGTSEMQLVYEIGLTKGVRAVLCLQENTVTGAADGYGRMAGRPAFTLLHVGSGLANGIANIHNAGRANTPMINIVGDINTLYRKSLPRDGLDLDHPRAAVGEELARPLVAAIGQLDHGESVVHATHLRLPFRIDGSSDLLPDVAPLRNERIRAVARLGSAARTPGRHAAQGAVGSDGIVVQAPRLDRLEAAAAR